MKTGTIKNLIEDKGFGFIESEEAGQKDLFFHATKCTTPFDELRKGDEVRYEIGKSDKGPVAEQVTLV